MVAGDEDADPRAARIIASDADDNADQKILSGSVESHSDLLAPA